MIDNLYSIRAEKDPWEYLTDTYSWTEDQFDAARFTSEELAEAIEDLFTINYGIIDALDDEALKVAAYKRNKSHA